MQVRQYYDAPAYRRVDCRGVYSCERLTADMGLFCILSVRVLDTSVCVCSLRANWSTLCSFHSKLFVKASNVIEFDLVLNFAFYFKTRSCDDDVVVAVTASATVAAPQQQRKLIFMSIIFIFVFFFSSAPKWICIWNAKIDTEWEKERVYDRPAAANKPQNE